MGVTPPPTVQADLQFAANHGHLYLDRFADPSGRPLDVLDKDRGATLTGRIELPGYIAGKGILRLNADQIGAQFDATIAELPVPIPGGSGMQMIPWTLPVDLDKPSLKLPADEMFHLGLVLVVQPAAGGHNDIGAFLDLGVFLVV